MRLSRFEILLFISKFILYLGLIDAELRLMCWKSCPSAFLTYEILSANVFWNGPFDICRNMATIKFRVSFSYGFLNILNIGRRYDLNKIAEVICAVVLFSLYKSRAYCLNLSFFNLTFWYIKITIDAIIVTIAYVSLNKL